MRLTSRYTARIRWTPRLSNDRVAIQLEFQRKNTPRFSSSFLFLSFPFVSSPLFLTILVFVFVVRIFPSLRFLLAAIFADGCWSAKFGRDEFARKVKLEKRNDRSPQSNILSLKVYKSPECIYTFRKCIFCTYLHYGREYLRENGYENGRRIL